MGEEKVYQVVVPTPAKNRYQLHVLPYLYDNFSFERATKIDENILSATGKLDKKPNRGRKEEYLRGGKEEFRFILFKETRHFELLCQ